MPSTYARKSAERIQLLRSGEKKENNEPWKEAEEKIKQIEAKVENVSSVLEEMQACFEEQRRSHARAFGLLVRRIDCLESSQSEFFGNLQRKVEDMIEKETDKKVAIVKEEENLLGSQKIRAEVEEILREFRIAKSSLENRVDDSRSAFEGKLKQVEASVDSKVECLKQVLLAHETQAKNDIKDLVLAFSGEESSKEKSCMEEIGSRLNQLETMFAKVATDGEKAGNTDAETMRKKKANSHRRYRIHLRPQPQQSNDTIGAIVIEKSNSLSSECFVENTDRRPSTIERDHKCVALKLKNSFASVSSTLATMNGKFADVRTALECIENTCTPHPVKSKSVEGSDAVPSRDRKRKSKNRRPAMATQLKENLQPLVDEGPSTKPTTPPSNESPRSILSNKPHPKHPSTRNSKDCCGGEDHGHRQDDFSTPSMVGTRGAVVLGFCSAGVPPHPKATLSHNVKGDDDQRSREQGVDNRQDVGTSYLVAGERGDGIRGSDEVPSSQSQCWLGGESLGTGRMPRRETLRKLFSELKELENESSETSSLL